MVTLAESTKSNPKKATQAKSTKNQVKKATQAKSAKDKVEKVTLAKSIKEFDIHTQMIYDYMNMDMVHLKRIFNAQQDLMK